MSFDHLFPEQAHFERCKMEFMSEEDGHIIRFDVLEFYCPDPHCDCHKVTLRILDQDQNTCATISYGWKRGVFYARWGLDPETIEMLTQGFLDPLSPQTEDAPVLLDAFRQMLKDRLFLRRLKQHYRQFKDKVAVTPLYHDN